MNVTPLSSSREAGTSPAARRNRLRRPALSHVLIALAAVLAFVFNFLALQDRSETTLVAVAGTRLLPGSPLSGADLEFVPIDADFEGIDALLTDESWKAMDGWVATRPISEGAPLDRTSFQEPTGSATTRVMSIPIAREHAAGGLLVSGDLVDIISVADGAAAYVSIGVQVVDVAAGETSGIGSGLGAYHIVVAVTADEALNIAAAIEHGSLEIVRSTGVGESDGS